MKKYKNYWKHDKDLIKPVCIFSIIGVIVIYALLRADGASHETSLFIMFLMAIFG